MQWSGQLSLSYLRYRTAIHVGLNPFMEVEFEAFDFGMKLKFINFNSYNTSLTYLPVFI